MTLQTQTNTVARIFAALAIAGMVALAGCLGGGGDDDVTPAPAPAPEPDPAPAPEPDPAPGRMTITPPASQTIENACADRGRLTYAFFEVNSSTNKATGGYWAGGSLAPGQKAEIETLKGCASGHRACYGAEPADGGGFWGVGLDSANIRRCDACCVACSSAGEARFSSVSLTCQAARQTDRPGSPNNRDPEKRGSIPAQTLTVGGSVMIDLSRYFTDPDGDELSYSRLLALGPVIVTAAVSGNTLRIEGVRAGEVTVRAVARDPAGRNEYQDIEVTVEANNRYGALAFSEKGRGGYAWAIDFGNSQSDAEQAAVNGCTSLGGTRCTVVPGERGVRLSGPDRCFAIARSEAVDAGRLPAFGFAITGTKAAADRGAIAQCERAAVARQLSGTCRLDTSRDGSPGSVCYGTAAR